MSVLGVGAAGADRFIADTGGGVQLYRFDGALLDELEGAGLVATDPRSQLALLRNSSGSLDLVSLSNDRITSVWSGSSPVPRAAVLDGDVVIGTQLGALVTWAVTPAGLVERDRFPKSNSTGRLAVASSVVALATNPGIVLVERAGADLGEMAGFLDPPWRGEIASYLDTDGAYLMAATTSGKVALYDVGDPASPQLLHSYESPGPLSFARLHDGLVWLGEGSDGLSVVDPAASWARVAHLAAPGPPAAAAFTNDHVVVAARNGGALVFRTYPQGRPRPLTRAYLPGVAR
jgi:hypothetical protein